MAEIPPGGAELRVTRAQAKQVRGQGVHAEIRVVLPGGRVGTKEYRSVVPDIPQQRRGTFAEAQDPGISRGFSGPGRKAQKRLGVAASRLACGIPMGMDIKYADEYTLAHAIRARQRMGGRD